MKIVVQHASDVPDGQIPERRTLGELVFTEKVAEPIQILTVSEAPVPVDEQGSLIFHVGFSPHNHGLSIMTGYRTAAGERHVFSAGVILRAGPTLSHYFAFRLPTGQFIELYLLPHDPGRPGTSR